MRVDPVINNEEVVCLDCSAPSAHISHKKGEDSDIPEETYACRSGACAVFEASSTSDHIPPRSSYTIREYLGS